MVILEAMSYELPTVTTNVWGNPEIIDDGKTGFLVEESAIVPYYAGHLIPKEGSADVIKAIKNPDQKLIRDLVDKTSVLVADEKLRKKIGHNARKEIESGKFSIKRRNEN